jgi:ABC-type amino acid transport substrate-binding protein
MRGHRVALLGAATAAVLATGCGQSAQAPDPAAATGTAQSNTAAPATATCATGWIAGHDASGAPRFFPDTPTGLRIAGRDSYYLGPYNTGVGQGVQVVFQDTRSVTVNRFVVELDNSQGDAIWSGMVNDQAGLPRYLAPGEAQTWTVDWRATTAARPPVISNGAYLHLKCVISDWN